MAAEPVALPIRDRTGICAFAVIDAHEAHFQTYRWHLHGDSRPAGKLYARSADGVFLHHAVLGVRPLPGFVVDHINGLTLDNRRANLRVLSIAENGQNRERRVAPTASRYRNVTFVKGRLKPWRASVRLNGRIHFLGNFEDEQEAAAVAETWRLEHLLYSTPVEIAQRDQLLARARLRPRNPGVDCPDCGRSIRPCNLAKHRAKHVRADATAPATFKAPPGPDTRRSVPSCERQSTQPSPSDP